MQKHRSSTGDSLRNPKYITGSNELHSLHQKTVGEICRVAERVSRLFPNTRLFIATLLLRNNIAPAVIHQINMEITRGCSKLPNIHGVRHSPIHLAHVDCTLTRKEWECLPKPSKTCPSNLLTYPTEDTNKWNQLLRSTNQSNTHYPHPANKIY